MRHHLVAFEQRDMAIFSGVVGPAVGTPLEEWSFRVAWDSGIVGSMTQVQRDALAAGLKTDYDNSISTVIADSNTFLTKVRVVSVASSGKYARDAAGGYVMGNAVATTAGGTAGPGYPLQTALVASFNTGRAGATGKGRIFLPWPKYAIAASTRTITSTQALAVADCVADFLHRINVRLATTGPAYVSVFSSKGYHSRVTSVRVGLVPDTQRSRRSRVPEGYVTSAVTV